MRGHPPGCAWLRIIHYGCLKPGNSSYLKLKQAVNDCPLSNVRSRA